MTRSGRSRSREIGLKKWLSKFFGQSEAEETPTYEWLEIGPENPFNVRVLDVRPLTQSVTAVTQNQDIARSFVELRQSDGSDLPSIPTDNWVSVSCSLEVPFPTEPTDGPLYKAAEMEDKWDIYAYESVLYFSRSWMGKLIYRAPFRINDGTAIINIVESAPGHSDKTDQAVFFLLVSHVLGKHFPNPIPSDIGNDAEQIALYSFNSYGRNAICATPCDVTSVSLPSDGEVDGR